MEQLSGSLSQVWQIVLSALSTGALVSVVAWAFREPIAQWFVGRVAHSRNKELEELKAAIERNRSETDFVRNYIAGGQGRAAELRVERRFEASTEIWGKVQELRQHKFLLEMLKSLKIGGIDSRIENDVKVQKFVGTLAVSLQTDDFKKLTSGFQQRLFISPLAWALFSAYQSTIAQGLGIWQVWKLNMPASNLFEGEKLIKMVEAALPHQKSFLDQYGVEGVFFLIDELEDVLLKELKSFMSDEATSQEASERAKTILKLANELTERKPLPDLPA